MKKSGFTLVELSIVLVIIGLLIGGILAAQSMIGTARINAQIQQIQQFDLATTALKQKYNQIPGDCNVCTSIASYYGNNNGRLETNVNVSPPNIFFYEISLYFPQLYTLQLLQGEYINAGSGVYEVGKTGQFPPAKIGTGGVIATSDYSGQIYYAFINKSLAVNNHSFASRMATGQVSSVDSLAIDSKTDDSLPTSGNIQVTSATVKSDGSIGIPFTADVDSANTCIYNNNYNVSVNNAAGFCRLIIKSGAF